MRILLVEDDEAIARFLVKGLREDQHLVELVTDGASAEALASVEAYDAILLDLMLPGLDGFDVCRRLRAHGVDTPILIITARDAVADRVTGLDAGADDYLVKPFAFSELLARVGALLRRGAPSGAQAATQLRMGDLEVKEITGGCICCQIGPDLVRTLHELEAGFRPHLVIVEASGIAAPPGVLGALKYFPAEKLDGIETVTVVDAARFGELYEIITPLLDSQIVAADRVAITKIDEATAEETDRTVEAVRLLAPAAPLYMVDATDEESLAGLLGDLLPGETRA